MATTAGDSYQLQERHASDTPQSVEYWARGAPQVLRLSLPHHRLLLLLFAVTSAIATLWHDRTSAPSHTTPCDDNVRLYCADFDAWRMMLSWSDVSQKIAAGILAGGQQ